MSPLQKRALRGSPFDLTEVQFGEGWRREKGRGGEGWRGRREGGGKGWRREKGRGRGGVETGEEKGEGRGGGGRREGGGEGWRREKGRGRGGVEEGSGVKGDEEWDMIVVWSHSQNTLFLYRIGLEMRLHVNLFLLSFSV